ncbi:glutathione S-transferase PARB-like [Primulina tabacum]|uniref:glutathione S-transferase PARB-like n=1 Tax=Primulina tabacum TaxID=48773 RepID=UPI003F592AE4
MVLLLLLDEWISYLLELKGLMPKKGKQKADQKQKEGGHHAESSSRNQDPQDEDTLFTAQPYQLPQCITYDNGLDYEFVPVNMRTDEHKKDPFISFQVSTNKNPKEMASPLVWMEGEAQKYDLAASKLTWELSFKPMMGKLTDDAVVKEYVSQLSKVLDVYEARSAHSK